MTAQQRVQQISDSATLSVDHLRDMMVALDAVEGDLPVYRHMGTPVWKIQEVKEEIERLRDWAKEELARAE